MQVHTDKQPPIRPSYRTVSELSTISRTPPSTIRRWATAGKIPGARKTAGGGWIIPLRDFILSAVYKRWASRHPDLRDFVQTPAYKHLTEKTPE